MGGRYYLTGIQIGMMEALVEKNPKQVIELLKQIEDEQYLCDAEDLEILKNKLKEDFKESADKTGESK